ncbi:MAG: hypothetical protein R3A45_11735 [Bdellovibrionota bacterium]
MEANSSFFQPQLKIFNTAMSVGIIQDFVAVWQKVKQLNKIPTTIIMLIDPWALNVHNNSDAWKSIRHLYQSFLEKDTYSNEENRVQTKNASLFAIKKKDIIPQSQMLSEMAGRRGDGGYIYPQSYLKPLSLETIQKKAAAYTQGCVFSMCPWEFDHQIANVLTQLFDEFHENTISLFVIVPPYEPSVYDFLVNEKEYSLALQEVQDFLENKLPQTTKLNFKLCNYLNPEIPKCNTLEYIDGMHYRKSCLRKQFRACLGIESGKILQ